MDRQAVLQALNERIASGEGVWLGPVRELAQDIGIPPQRLYYLIQAFQQAGAIWTRSRGPKGLEIRNSEGPAAGGGPVAVKRTVPRGGRSHFCPWCGQPAESGWRYCMACGKRLPAG